MLEGPRPTPRLIQRLEAAKNRPDRRGIDRFFSLDYMGSSEFEWGAIPEALRRMRAALTDEWAPVKVEHDGHTVWYVGPSDALDAARTLLADQLGPCRMRFQEWTGINGALTGDRFNARYVGWWAIDAAPAPWALLKEERGAHDFLAGLRDPAVKAA